MPICRSAGCFPFPSWFDQAVAIFCRFLKDCRLYPLVLGIPSAVFGDEQWASEDSRGSLFRGSSNEIPLDLRLPRREVVGWGCTQWNFFPELVGTFWFPPYLLGYRTVIGNIDLRLDTWDMGYHPCSPTDVGVVQRRVFNILQGQGLLHDNPTISLS